ncbi:MAG: hypothetical protein V1837_04120 [Candidatus Woesearchaeota archaeon]
MPRGRPVYSEVRQNMVEILAALKKGCGYDIYRVYRNIYPKITLRLVYYHLKKGVVLGEFKVHTVVSEKGDYSWGPEAQKIYYSLGEKATPKGDPRVTKYIDRKTK